MARKEEFEGSSDLSRNNCHWKPAVRCLLRRAKVFIKDVNRKAAPGLVRVVSGLRARKV